MRQFMSINGLKKLIKKSKDYTDEKFNLTNTCEPVPNDVTSIVELINMVPLFRIKTFFIGIVESGRLTDWPSTLSKLGILHLATITIKKLSLWSHITINSSTSNGLVFDDYSLEGLYVNGNLYWGGECRTA